MNFDHNLLLAQLLPFSEQISSQVQKFSHFKKSVCCAPITAKQVSFKCFTCEVRHDNQILCNECFQKADHKGHTYVFVNNLGGGYCDCGDMNALKEESVCSEHRLTGDSSKIKEEFDVKLYEFLKGKIQDMYGEIFKGLELNVREIVGRTQGASDSDYELWENVRRDKVKKSFGEMKIFLEEIVKISPAFSVVVANILMEAMDVELEHECEKEVYTRSERRRCRCNLIENLLRYIQRIEDTEFEESMGQFLIQVSSFKLLKSYLVRLFGNYLGTMFILDAEKREIRVSQISILYLLIFSKDLGEILYRESRFLENMRDSIRLFAREVMESMSSSAFRVIDKLSELVPYIMRNTQQQFYEISYEKRITHEVLQDYIDYSQRYRENRRDTNIRFLLVMDNCQVFFIYQWLRIIFDNNEADVVKNQEIVRQYTIEILQCLRRNTDSMNCVRLLAVMKFVLRHTMQSGSALIDEILGEKENLEIMQNNISVLCWFKDFANPQLRQIFTNPEPGLESKIQNEKVHNSFGHYAQYTDQKTINELFYGGRYYFYDLEMLSLQQILAVTGFKTVLEQFLKSFHLQEEVTNLPEWDKSETFRANLGKFFSAQHCEQKLQLLFSMLELLNLSMTDRASQLNIFGIFYLVEKKIWYRDLCKFKNLQADFEYVFRSFFLMRSSFKYPALKEQILQIFQDSFKYDYLIPGVCNVEEGQLQLKQKVTPEMEFSAGSVQKSALVSGELRQSLKDFRKVLGNEARAQEGSLFAQIRESLSQSGEIFHFMSEVLEVLAQQPLERPLVAEIVDEILKMIFIFVKQQTLGYMKNLQLVAKILDKLQQAPFTTSESIRINTVHIKTQIEKQFPGVNFSSQQNIQEQVNQIDEKKLKILKQQQMMMEKMRKQQQQVSEKYKTELETELNSTDKQGSEEKQEIECQACREIDNKQIQIICLYQKNDFLNDPTSNISARFSSCGHHFHYKCLIAMDDKFQQGSKIRLDLYLCPICKSFNNNFVANLLPIFAKVAHKLEQKQHNCTSLQETFAFFNKEGYTDTPSELHETFISEISELIPLKNIQYSLQISRQYEFFSTFMQIFRQIVLNGLTKITEPQLILHKNMFLQMKISKIQFFSLQFGDKPQSIEKKILKLLQPDQLTPHDFFSILKGYIYLWNYVDLADTHLYQNLLKILTPKLILALHAHLKIHHFQLLQNHLKTLYYLSLIINPLSQYSQLSSLQQIETEPHFFEALQQALQTPELITLSKLQSLDNSQVSTEIQQQIEADLNKKFSIRVFANFEEMVKKVIPQKCGFCKWYINQSQGIMFLCLICGELMCKGKCTNQKMGNLNIHTEFSHNGQCVYLSLLQGVAYIHNSALKSLTVFGQLFYDKVGNPHQLILFEGLAIDWENITMDVKKVDKLNYLIHNFQLNQIIGSQVFDGNLTQYGSDF